MINLDTVGIWEALMEGKPVSSILNDVPDEFFEKVRQYENELKGKFREMEQKSDRDYWSICNHINSHNFVRSATFRKEFAEFATRTENSAILFAMLDRKDYSKIIWKIIKPKFEKL